MDKRYDYDVVGIGVTSWDCIGVAKGAPMMGVKQGLEQWVEAGGGPVPTALTVLARWGLSTSMVGAVGSDPYGERILAALRQEGIATTAMHVGEGTSHVAFALVEPAAQRRTIWWHNDRAVLDGVQLDRHLVTSAQALHIDTHLPELALRAAGWMREAGGRVMIDAERVKEQTIPLLPLCDAIIVSERFGREMTGEPEPSQSAQLLFAQYGGIVVVTAGERGCWCVMGEGEGEGEGIAFHTPAFSVDVVDTTGAGDVFHGAFLYGWLQDWNIREVVRFASATAALKCRAVGGRAGIPSLAEVRAFIG